MELQKFTEKMKKALTEYYGTEAEIKIHKVNKNNGIRLQGFSVLKKGKNIAPTVYLESFFTSYQRGETFGELVKELIGMVKDFPEMYHDIEVEFEALATRFEGIIKLLPQNMKDGWNMLEANLEVAIGEWIGSLSEPTVEFAGNVAKSIPSILIGVIITILASYFFVADRESVISWAKKYTPSPIQRRMTMVVSYFKHAIGGYFKAQFQIMIVLSTMLFIGFTLIDVKYAIVLAILFAFLDFLPFFGTAITLVPWAIYEVLGGDYKRAIVLLVLYVLTQLTRQVIQPKLVSNEVGLKPIPTLVLLYLGYKVGSVWGMIFAVPIGLILINMYKSGAFDYILDDVKILVHGIMKLRE